MNKACVNMGIACQEGNTGYADNNTEQIAICELQRGELNWAQGRQPFALGLAGELNSVYQMLHRQHGKLSMLSRERKKVDDKGQGKGSTSKWMEPSTDDTAWGWTKHVEY